MLERTGIAVVAVSFLLAAVMTGWLRRMAVARGLIDVPNARSSHQVPTPRGGGLAVAVVVLCLLPLLGWWRAVPGTSLWSLFVAGFLVAGIGWLDDHNDIAAGWRLLVHFAAASIGVWVIGGLPPVPMFGFLINLGWVGHGLAVVYLVWLLNLYNFMDGLDGIAGIEAVTVGAGGLWLYQVVGHRGGGIILPAILVAAVGGFLLWNFPRARVFMGDVGSGFVGIALGLLSLHAAWVSPPLFWGWVILLGVFVVDATVTLLRRLFSGEHVYRAHRSHAYQKVAQRIGSHPPVSMGVGLINLLWLLPVATLVALGTLDGVVGVLIAYAPLIGLAVHWEAGGAEDKS
ncbi:MAG: glycosyltransferase family 4 protein [Gemmatimonadetes bacterium]|nr:glycosyltransferase family 4 protein [Gemmatimonadota bacterium]